MKKKKFKNTTLIVDILRSWKSHNTNIVLISKLVDTSQEKNNKTKKMLCCVVLCCVVLCCVVLCSVVLCCDVLCCVVLCCVLFCSVLFCCILFCSVLFCSVLFSSVLFCSVSSNRRYNTFEGLEGLDMFYHAKMY